MPDLDRMLEQELQRRVAAHPGSAADPGAARYHTAFLRGGMHMPFTPSFLAGLSAKGAAGLAVATIAVGGGAAATVATHSVDPVNWAQAFVTQVKDCHIKGGHVQTPTGSATAKVNTGQCVSAIAKMKGQMERAAHAHATPSGKPSGLPSGRPSGLPTGRPSGLPTPGFSGKPSGLPTPKGKGNGH